MCCSYVIKTFGNVLIVPVIESTFPLSGSTASKDSTSLATTGRWLARRWSAQSGSRCTPMLVCAFVPVRSNSRSNISFLSNWSRTRARRCRAPWVPRRPRISSGILSRLRAPEHLHRTPRLLAAFFSAPFLPWHFYFQCYIQPERSSHTLTDTLCDSRELFPIHDCK